MVWRLIDLFRRNGRWAKEAQETVLEDTGAEVGR
jgi:hypothetical protein